MNKLIIRTGINNIANEISVLIGHLFPFCHFFHMVLSEPGCCLTKVREKVSRTASPKPHATGARIQAILFSA